MTLHERLKVYEDQHGEMEKHFQDTVANLHRLGGAIAAVKDQIEEEAKAILGDKSPVEGELLPPE
jgi:hypothetical protein